jgi:hypothetical protein
VIQLPLPGLLTEETIVPYLVWRNAVLYSIAPQSYPQLRYDAWSWTSSYSQQDWFITKLIPQAMSLRDN